MVLKFRNRKHSVSIFVNLVNYMIILIYNPHLYLYGSLIPVVDEAKFLGVIFDQKLSFILHIKYLKAKCLKALNLLKVLSHTSWGTDPYCPPTSLSVFNSVKVRLRSHCLWICSKVLFSNVRYSTPSRTSTGFGSLSNIACRKSIRGSITFTQRKNLLFNMPSDLLLIHLILLTKLLSHHILRKTL